MTVGDLEEILSQVKDKSMEVIVPDMEFGFRSACYSDTGVTNDSLEIPVFVIMPCFCTDDFDEDDDIGDDFEITDNGIDPQLN